MKTVTLLGATGSIGQQTLSVIAQHPDQFRVLALTAKNNIDKLFEQCVTFKPEYAWIEGEKSAIKLRDRLQSQGITTTVYSAYNDLLSLAAMKVDCVVAAIVGLAGLKPTFAAARAGNAILLANKETIVSAGELFMQTIAQSGAYCFPLDSEHNAIMQCYPDNYSMGTSTEGVEMVTLTASGGPFRESPLSELCDKTPQQAIAHPNWSMGHKISVDSATLMNKGFEVIEAHWLFNLPFDKIAVQIHPQSIVHAMVQYCDGSVITHMANPDMRIPISYALGYPNRLRLSNASLTIANQTLTFFDVERSRYPSLALAYAAGQAGGNACAMLTIANDYAVQCFLEGKIIFTRIAECVDSVMQHFDCTPYRDIAELFELKHRIEQFLDTKICYSTPS